MGSQTLSRRSVRRIERATGLDIAFAVGHGGYIHAVVTVDHRHGWFDLKTGEWGMEPVRYHYTSCRLLFPDDFQRSPGVQIPQAVPDMRPTHGARAVPGVLAQAASPPVVSSPSSSRS